MQPVAGRAVWRRAELEDPVSVEPVFSTAELAELDAAADNPQAPMPLVAERCARIRDALEHGVGFVRVPGIAMERDGQADEERLGRALLALAGKIGTPVSQTTAGDLLFRVADAGLGASDAKARGPNSRRALTFHSDRCDVIGFLCVRRAAQGGENIIVSAGAIHNEILRRRPDLLAVLYEPFYWKRHNIDTANDKPWYRMPVFAQEQGAFAITLMQVLIDRAHHMPELPNLTPEQAEALALVQSLAAEPEYQVRLMQQPGEVLLMNNYVTLHSRTEFTDEPEAPGRLLLRVWISVPNSRPLPASWAAHYGGHEAGKVRGGIRTAAND